MGKMYRKFDTNILISYLDGANGQYLEFIGDMMGVSRLGEQNASISSAEKNIKFYVDVGTFGDINSGLPISIPAGTLVSTGAGGTGVVYMIPFTVILSSADTFFYVAAQSIRAGSDQNVGSRQLVYHDFIGYSDSVNNSLKVVNDAEISVAQDVESDTNLRYRIANRVVAAEAANVTAIRIAALSVPGVADLIILPFYKGIGTTDLLIKATVPSVPDSLLTVVQNTVDEQKASGTIISVRGPKETGFSMTATLTMRRQLSATEQSNIIAAVSANITTYINSLDIGEEFIVNEAVERVMATSAEIKNVGVANQPFDSLFIYKESKVQDTKVRNTLLGDYTPDADERIIVENRYAGNTPILIKIA